MSKFNFKKKYGQNFLQNKAIINKIVNTIHPTENDLIIEIGPGAGAITSELKKYNANLIAFEIDEETKRFLLPLENSKTKIIYQNFLDVKLNDYTTSFDNIYIIGNLPYYITTAILEKIIDSQINEKSVTIMVQKEVADRFMAKPHTKEYGYMTVLLNYSYDIEKVCNVPRTEFIPAPNVDSTVIKLTRKNLVEVDYQKFKMLLKNSFQFKRKTINNNLKNYDLNKIEKVLKENGYTLQSRAEEINLDTYIKLANNL